MAHRLEYSAYFRQSNAALCVDADAFLKTKQSALQADYYIRNHNQTVYFMHESHHAKGLLPKMELVECCTTFKEPAEDRHCHTCELRQGQVICLSVRDMLCMKQGLQEL